MEEKFVYIASISAVAHFCTGAFLYYSGVGWGLLTGFGLWSIIMALSIIGVTIMQFEKKDHVENTKEMVHLLVPGRVSVLSESTPDLSRLR